MKGRIPQSFIDEVINQTDIAELINGYVELKQKGKEYVACCPFHHEKTPSFTVSVEKQFYHCFGCGAHGTAVGFLMEKEGLPFVEAIEVLADRLGWQLPEETGTTEALDQNSRLYAVLDAAAAYYYKQLGQFENVQNYLKSRGISGQTAKNFQLGFAPDQFDYLQKSHLQEFETELLISSGLQAKNQQGSLYDRFRNRLMFPIRDYRGRVIGFGGRVMDQSLPKYMNSPETAIFHKSQTLYGLYEARQTLGRFDQVIIVEGYMDVIALAQHGIHNAVATLGTATTNIHIKALLRFASELVFCFDGDDAGRKAAWKALTQLLPEFKDGIEIRFLFLPQGEDPDSFVKTQGAAAFSDRLTQATPLAKYFFNTIEDGIDYQDPAASARVAKQARPLLNSIPDCIFKNLMFNELEKRIGTRLQEAAKPRIKPIVKKHGRSPRNTKVRLAIALLLHNPRLHTLALPVEDLDILTDQSGIPLFIEMLQILEQEPNLTTPALLQRFYETEWHLHLSKLLQWKNPDLANPEVSFRDTMRAFQKEIHSKSFDDLID